jgi:hypothetical protein
VQPPPSPVSERLRTIRRRVTVGVLATFVAAWLAVAALGKGAGGTSSTPTPAPTSTAAPDSTPAPSAADPFDQPDDGGAAAGPVTSSQS